MVDAVGGVVGAVAEEVPMVMKGTLSPCRILQGFGNRPDAPSLRPMELRDGLRSTGSVRAFSTEPVTAQQVTAVLDTARFAPSGGNKQGWHVITVQDPGTRRELCDLAVLGWREYMGLTAAGHRPFATDDTGVWQGIPDGLSLDDLRTRPAPLQLLDELTDGVAMLIVCADLRVIANVDVDSARTKLAAGGSIYPFVWNMLLAARAEGLGGVMTTFVIRQQEAARALLRIPDAFGIASMVFIGHPVHQNTKLTRRPVESFTTIDRFDGEPLRSARWTGPSMTDDD